MSDENDLPLTRQWLLDYSRWGTDPKSPEGPPEPAIPFEQWLKDNAVPDLQELVAAWGGYDKITPEAWAAYDRALADWERRRRERGV
jgi:hypothetical protein